MTSAPLKAFGDQLANSWSPSRPGKALKQRPPSSPSNKPKREPGIPALKLPSAKGPLMPSFDSSCGVLPLQSSTAFEPHAAASEDALTPRLLEALAMLDEKLDEVGGLEAKLQTSAGSTSARDTAMDDDDEPAWLTVAAAVASAQSLPGSPAPGLGANGGEAPRD